MTPPKEETVDLHHSLARTAGGIFVSMGDSRLCAHTESIGTSLYGFVNAIGCWASRSGNSPIGSASSYDQFNKYERTVSQLDAGRFFEIAQALNVEVGYFFAGLDEPSGDLSPRQRMCLELTRNFAAIPNEHHQEALYQLTRVHASE